MNKKQALRAFVFEQSTQDLAQRLWDCAQANQNTMLSLIAWQTQASPDHAPQAMLKTIADLLEPDDYDYQDNRHGWAAAGDYADRAEKALPILEKLAEKSPAIARQACADALHQLYRAAEQSHESDGTIDDLMQAVQEILIDTFQAAPPPAQWIDDWLALMAADPFGLWDEQEVLTAAGTDFQRSYSQRVAQDWRDYLGKTTALKKDKYYVDYERAKLRKRYADDLKRQADQAGILALLESTLSSAREHSELIAHYESLGKWQDALELALSARERYPDDASIEADLLRNFVHAGDHTQALAIHRQRLEKSPCVAYFQAALDAAVAAGKDRAAYREQLYAWAAAQEIAPKPANTWQRMQRTEQGRDVGMRVQWLLHEQCLDQALDLVQLPHTCESRLLQSIANSVRSKQPEAARGLLQRVFALHMPNASTPYADVLQLVKAIAPLMGKAERDEWIAHLRTLYKPKRNFIKGLDALKL